MNLCVMGAASLLRSFCHRVKMWILTTVLSKTLLMIKPCGTKVTKKREGNVIQTQEQNFGVTPLMEALERSMA